MYKPGTTIQVSSYCTNFIYTDYSVTQSPDSIYELRHKLSTKWESTGVMQQQMLTETERWTGQMYGLDSVQLLVLLQSEFL